MNETGWFFLASIVLFATGHPIGGIVCFVIGVLTLG
jgi:hypothetical protein